jgi:YVTN family beta-propeller protein
VLSIAGPDEFSSNLRPVGDEEGERFEFTFTKPGQYTYICPTHPYMKGIIGVDTKPDKDKLWPPEEIIKPALLPPPQVPGIGEVWVDTQFEIVPGQKYPGTITVIDATTWQIKRVISDPSFNNPHNLWHSYDEKYIFQTQWHADSLNKIDAKTGEILKTVKLGNAPAHAHTNPKKERVYVTLNNENRTIILDYDLNIVGEIKTSFGPHGVWIDPSGKWMSVAATLEGKFNIIDLEQEKIVATFDVPGLPLASAITHDGRYAMISMLLEGRVRVIDLKTLKHIKDITVGKSPIWPAPGPDGKLVFVANTGSADISVISLDTLEVIKTLPAASGVHGITFGPKQDGGYYGYFSNKFARVVGVIDPQKLETVGYIKLSDTAWGGNGILALPNAYDEYIEK